MSGGREAPRDRGRSMGSVPLRSMRSMTARRLTAALTSRSRHTGASGDAEAASRSRAKSASAGVWESRLREWRSLTSSGASNRMQPGCGPWVSRQRRLEKPVLSVI